MTGISSGGGGGYDYVETFYPSDAEEGEELYHLTKNAAFVFNGAEWIEQTVTDHSQLSGVTEGDHRSDSRVSALAPLQTVNGRTGDVTGLFEASNYTPEEDVHDPVPSGVITMWSGDASNTPDGWTLCDGTDGTPDLRDRFIAGAGGSMVSGETGGKASGNNQIISDAVSSTEGAIGKTDGGSGFSYQKSDGSYLYTSYGGSSSGVGVSYSVPKSDPKYLALAFIMKL